VFLRFENERDVLHVEAVLKTILESKCGLLVEKHPYCGKLQLNFKKKINQFLEINSSLEIFS
jgi:predicted secreted Zn-dependent protease